MQNSDLAAVVVEDALILKEEEEGFRGEDAASFAEQSLPPATSFPRAAPRCRSATLRGLFFPPRPEEEAAAREGKKQEPIESWQVSHV